MDAHPRERWLLLPSSQRSEYLSGMSRMKVVMTVTVRSRFAFILRSSNPRSKAEFGSMRRIKRFSLDRPPPLPSAFQIHLSPSARHLDQSLRMPNQIPDTRRASDQIAIQVRQLTYFLSILRPVFTDVIIR